MNLNPSSRVRIALWDVEDLLRGSRKGFTIDGGSIFLPLTDADRPELLKAITANALWWRNFLEQALYRDRFIKEPTL